MRTSFFPFTEPSVEFDVTCFLCDGEGCAVCKHSGWIEMGGAGWVDPDVFRNVASTPSSGRGSPSGSGSSASPCSGTACPTCAPSGRTTSGSWGSSDEGPRLLAARVRRAHAAGRASSRAGSSSRAARSTASSVAASPTWMATSSHFVVGKVLEADEASERGQAPADEGRRRRRRAALDRLRGVEFRRRRDGRGRRSRRGDAGRTSRSRSASCAARSPTG